MAKLKIKDEHNKERIHELVDDVTSIGRSSENTIQITDEKASRHHFRIEKKDGKFVVQDLGSTNGTRLNGQKVRADTALRTGDTLCLGKTTFEFDDPTQVPAASEPLPTGGETVALDAVSESEVSPPPPPPPPPAEEGPKFVLKMLEGKTPGKVFELGVKALTIGRHASSTIQIIDDAASNYHAEINREPIGYVLSDLGSTNGTRVRGKNKNDFEKIIKTPLVPGMQIRIGKTLLEYDNVGKPVEEEDQLFGTIALDPEKLEAQLAPKRRRLPKVLLPAALLVVFAGAVAAIVRWLPPPAQVEGQKHIGLPPEPVANKILNGSFDEGTDDDGNPKCFRVERGVPGVKVEVRAEADVASSAGKKGLQVAKAGEGKAASTRTIVETANSFGVDPSKVYEFSGSMRNDGDGLFGLRVTWIQGDRQFTEYPVVLKDSQQDWKNRSVLLTPPAWAQRAKAGVFVQGKDGAAQFDTLCFIERPEGKPLPRPSIKYAGIEVGFEGTKGAFTAESQGIRMVEDVSLTLTTPDGAAQSDLATALKPQFKAESNQVVFSGEMYDFALQDVANYAIQAQQGANGVEVRAALDAAAENGSTPQLSFFVVGPGAQGNIEADKGGGAIERVLATEDKRLTGVSELVFNAGKVPQLDISFAKPADVSLKREGTRRRVTLRFRGELRFALAPESVGAKREMLAAIAALQQAVQNKKWNDVEAGAAKLTAAFASRYPQAKDEADAAQKRMNEEWQLVADDLDRAVKTLALAPTPEAVDIATNAVSRHVAVWAGTRRESELRDNLARINAIKASSQNTQAETRAAGFLKIAQNALVDKQYALAVSYLRLLQKDEYVNTKVAEKARQLLPEVERLKQRQADLRQIVDRLRDDVRQYERSGQYQRAVEIIEKDKDFQANRKDLGELEEYLTNLRKKATQQ